MDPAGLAPASLRANGRILLHKTTDPDPRRKRSIKEKGPQIGPFSQHVVFGPLLRSHLPLAPSYSLPCPCQGHLF